jgi:SpoVK/Ycf46/Vps4 family AAA+-type ATPase
MKINEMLNNEEVSQRDLLEFQVFGKYSKENRVNFVLLYGPKDTEKEILSKKLSQKLNFSFHKITFSTLLLKNSDNTEFSLASLLQQMEEEKNLVFFEDCETMFNTNKRNFHTETFLSMVDAFLEEKENKSQFFFILSTSRPSMLPKIILERVGIPIFVAHADSKERTCFIKEQLNIQLKRFEKSEIDESIVNQIVEHSVGCSSTSISKYIELVFQKKTWKKEKDLPTHDDFKALKYLLKGEDASSNLEFFRFAQEYNQTIPVQRIHQNEEDDAPGEAAILSKLFHL